MLRHLLCLIVFVSSVLSHSTLSTVALAADEKKASYQLPKDAKAVVLSYDSHSGFGPPRANKNPMLSILADGTVLMPDRYGRGGDVTGKISAAELQGLLHFAVEDNKFFSFDTDKVKVKMKAAEQQRQIPQIADAPVSAFFIQLAKRSHGVSHYAMGMASQYPEITELQQLNAIADRLRKLMNKTRVGGDAGVAKLLKAANKELKKQHPGVKSLAAEHFSGSYTRPDGITSATFARYGMTAAGKRDGSYVVAVIQAPKQGEPQVTIRMKAKR